MVLLKNDGLLPPAESGKEDRLYRKICPEAQIPGRRQLPHQLLQDHGSPGGGRAAAEITSDITYAQGYDTAEDRTDPALLAEAVKAAEEADVAVIFAGLPDAFESEGYDRSHMQMPECQNELIREILRVQKNTVVVLHNGSPVEMPWAGDVNAILESYLCGQAVGAAQVRLLFGLANPCGKLAETIPLKLQDNPSYLNFTLDRVFGRVQRRSVRGLPVL